MKIAAMVALVLAVLGLAFGWELATAQRSMGLRLYSTEAPYAADVELTLSAMDASALRVTGMAKILLEIRDGDMIPPPEDKGSDQIARISQMILTLGRFSEGDAEYPLDGTDAPTATIDLKGGGFDAKQGEAVVFLPLQPIAPAIWYPFDSYLLRVVPHLIIPDQPGGDSGTMKKVEAMRINFDLPDVRITAEPDDTRGDHVEMRARFDRPLTTRVLAGMIGLVSIVWLYWLARHARVETQVGQLVAFFVSIWGWKSVLASTDRVFPSILDYSMLGLSIIAVGIVLIRWWEGLGVVTNKTCPQCASEIPLKALVCGQCRSLQPAGSDRG